MSELWRYPVKSLRGERVDVADAELHWAGYGLRIGGALIGVRNRRSRCVMTTFDPDTLEQDPTVLLRVVRSFGGRVALDCWVERPGEVRVGDQVEVVELPAGLAA